MSIHPLGGRSALKTALIRQWVVGEFPSRQNREFFAPEPGNYLAKPGNRRERKIAAAFSTNGSVPGLSAPKYGVCRQLGKGIDLQAQAIPAIAGAQLSHQADGANGGVSSSNCAADARRRRIASALLTCLQHSFSAPVLRCQRVCGRPRFFACIGAIRIP